MNPIILSMVGLRGVALALSLLGEKRGSDTLYALADLVGAGLATDAHMQHVADRLKAGPLTAADWDDLDARIKADRDRLHSPPGQ
jgi:hypothetical protein